MTVFKEVCRTELQGYKCELILKGRATEVTWGYVRLIKIRAYSWDPQNPWDPWCYQLNIYVPVQIHMLKW